MALGQSLQGGQRRGHHEEVGIGHRLDTGRDVLEDSLGIDDEVTHTPAIQIGNIAVTVVPGRRQGEEQGLLRKTKGAAVCEQPSYLGIGATDTSRPDECCDLFNRITFHMVTLF